MKFALALCFLLLTASPLPAENWPHWRGPQWNGSTTETGLPSRWSRTEGIAWKARLDGAAASTPIVWEDRVFLSGLDAEKDTLQAMCFDRTDGKLLWKEDVAEGTSRDDRSNFAAPSPVTDGKSVYFFFSSGELIAYDFDGQRRWARNLQEDYGTFAFNWTFSSSPTLYDGKLLMQVLQRDVPVGGRGFTDRTNESYLLAMDPDTGKTLWRHVRPSDAVAESREAFSTVIPCEDAGRRELLVAGGDALTGHDPKDGKELWRWDHLNPNKISHWRLVPSPVAGGGVALICGPKMSPVFAVKGGLSGELDDDDLAWVSGDVRTVNSDVPTPAFYDGDFFILSDLGKSLSRVAPASGEVKWTLSTPGRAKYEASPLAADGKIYLVNFDGQVTVVDAGSGELLASIPMDEPQDREVVRSSIAASQGQLFIRTTRELYCTAIHKDR
ncbi:MAG: outer membrane protein assembly factor BamB family protein [Thermoguttaceae bacterium]